MRDVFKISEEEIISIFGPISNKKYICSMDLELTCWEDVRFSEDQEIIEIGICVLDINTYEVVKEISRTVRPTKNPILSDYCKTLTNISQKEVDSSDTLVNVYKEITRTELPKIEEFIWASWGRDPEWIQRELVELSQHNFWLDPRYIDVKLCTGIKMGMAKYMNTIELSFDGIQHRALPDAQNLSKIIKSMELEPSDYRVSNNKTYKQRLINLRKRTSEKFSKRNNINEDISYNLLDSCNWNYRLARGVLKNLREGGYDIS